MDVNFVNLYAFVSAVTSVGIIAYLVPRQFKETKRPLDGFSRLRRRLFVQPILALLLIATRIPFFLTSLNVPSRSTGAAIVSVATSTGLFLFVYNMYLSYTYKEDK